MFRTFVFVTAILAISFFIGCSDNSTEPIAEKSNTLLPLTVGNTWNYKLYNQSSDSTGQVIWVIDKIISVDGKDYYLINSTGFGFGSNSFVAIPSELVSPISLHANE